MEGDTFTTSNARTGDPVVIEGDRAPHASFTVPTTKVMRNGTMHFILAVTNQGSPSLTRYRRVIVEVKDA